MGDLNIEPIANLSLQEERSEIPILQAPYSDAVSSGGTHILFEVSTYYQLMTSINLKLSLYPDTDADLLLVDVTDFSEKLPSIIAAGVFKHVYNAYIWKEIQRQGALSAAEKTEQSDPDSLYASVGLPNYYTDMYATCTRLSCMLYYYLVLKKVNIRAHFYEDGPTSYYQSILSKFNADGLSHDKYGEFSLKVRHPEWMLYEPELFCGKNHDFPLTRLPRLAECAPLKGIVEGICGTADLPDEKYIYFAEYHCASTTGRVYNDFPILEQIASVVGKKNIAVKLHPRCPANRFTPAGYHVMENQACPWELSLINKEMHDKVLITIRSTSVITPYTLFGQRSKVICLLDMVKGSDVIEWNIKYKRKLRSVFNQDEKLIAFPKDMAQLKEYLLLWHGEDRLREYLQASNGGLNIEHF